MNEKIKGIMTEAGISVEYVTNTKQIVILEKFAELIIQECIACCGSQADMKNIRKRFGLPTESNVKYPGQEAQGHHSQYGREYNIPK
jgi:hypothetical protein